MGSNPINLILRFCLELVVLVSAGFWGWHQSTNWSKFVFAVGVPISLALIWGVFNVPNDPSRSGNSLIVTPGIVRLGIELSFFSFATWTLFNLGFNKVGYSFGLITTLHYLASFNRIKWLLSH